MILTKEENTEIRKLLLLSTIAGKIMLQNGAETYRVEDTIERICRSRMGIKYVNAFVVPTGIIISLDYKGELITYLTRISGIQLNLHKINLVNEFSRDFVNSNMSLDEGIKKLKQINKTPNYTNFTKAMFGGIACGVFAVLFDGALVDFFPTALISIGILSFINALSKYKLTFFLNNFLGAAMTTLAAIGLTSIGFGENMDKIIIGSIMCLVPGVAITNAMRDTMSGDFTAGLSRGMEAVFSALAIAFGVGLVLNFYFRMVV